MESKDALRSESKEAKYESLYRFEVNTILELNKSSLGYFNLNFTFPEVVVLVTEVRFR